MLVTIAKAYSGLTDAEIREVDAFIRRNMVEKFGPVRTVKPELVFELAFEGLNRSSRHKSGIAVRFPRILRWRTDKKATQADTIDRSVPCCLLNSRFLRAVSQSSPLPTVQWRGYLLETRLPVTETLVGLSLRNAETSERIRIPPLLVFEAARFSWGEKGAELEVVGASLAASQLGTELMPMCTGARTTEALSQCRRAQRPVLLKLCHSSGVPIALTHK